MDTVEITLPKSQKKVVIRSYTTHKDDSVAEAALTANVIQSDPTTAPLYPVINFSNYRKAYINSLTISVDGKSDDIETQLESLRSIDYAAVDEAVDKIVQGNSPKAQEVSVTSKLDTSAK